MEQRYEQKRGQGTRRLAAGGWRLAAGGWRLAAGGWRLAAGGWRLAAGGWRLAAGGGRLAAGGGRPNEMFSDFREHVAGIPQVAPSLGNVTFDGPAADEDFGL